jgi:carbonic anhydrase/acetyltransferase-like protein (isoleucine patch superfamily)
MIKSFDGKTPRIAESAYIDESAYIMGDVEIGENCIVFPGAVLRGDFAGIRIGHNVWIEDNCAIHCGPRDLIIGNDVTIGHGAVVNCHRLGNNVLVGMSATLLHEAEIGNDCVIGAATLVGEGVKIPDNSFVVGVPGKIRGNPTEKQLSWIRRDPEKYPQFVKAYKAGKFQQFVFPTTRARE